MTSLSGKPVSFWLDSTAKTTYPKMANVNVDVAIIGEGKLLFIYFDRPKALLQ